MEDRQGCEYGREKQRFVGICQLNQNLFKSSHLVQQRSVPSPCSETTVTSSVPEHLFPHKSGGKEGILKKKK